MHFKSLWIAMMLMGIVSAPHAQEKRPRAEPPGTVYKQTLPDGSVIYTDKPNRAVKIEKTLAPEPASAYVPRIGSTGGMPPAFSLQRPSGSVLTPGTPGTAIPSMPPLPGDSVLRPMVAPVVSPSTDPTPKPVLLPVVPIEDEIAAAEEVLSRAKNLQTQGVASAPGDRNGTASGGSRLNSNYQKRQEELAASVRDAQTDLERLYLKKRGL